MAQVKLEVEMFQMPNFMRVKAIAGDSKGVDVGALFPTNNDAAEFWDEAKLIWLAHVERRRNALVRSDKL